MEECNDNRSMVNTVCKTTPSPKLKPKKRSLVERELETSLTSRITSPISNSETINTSRYGRARRLKNDLLISTDRKKDSPSPINNTEKSPNEELCTYKMYASTSPAKTQSTKNGLDNQIENIYNQNLSLSRFNSDGKTEKNLKSKIYMRQDLIQTRDKEETIILIKNMFSPNQNVPQEEFTSSSEKSSKNYKRQLSSVVKTLDFDGKKKREGQEKKMTQSDLFELEAQCEYQVGDLAWARMGTYPFWPSIVTREPNSNLFIKKKLFGKLEKDIIHVTFLGDNGRRGWILLSMLRKYLGPLEFEKARDNFSSDAKRKDYRLYAAFFVTGKRLPLWHLSVEEAEVLFKEPKRFRIDTLNSMLNKGKECKSIPAKSKKVKSTDSDISLSESLYDSLFSEDDYKVSDTESGRCKTGKKPFDVSEVVTACLDNMAAKTGITKIQKQSHMDIWLQKAKSKTPEKCQLKQLKPEKKVITKYNESHGSMEYKQNHEKEHDYFTKSANTNGYFNDEIVDSPTNSTSVFLNNETDGANEECTNIIDKDILGISPEIMEENFTEIEVITNENMILDACDIKDLVFELDQNNHNEEHENNENLLEFNTKPNLEIANEESKFILFDKESNNEDYVTEKCGKECNADIQRVRGNCKNICIDNNLPETDNIIKKNIVTNVECYSNNFDDINVLTSGDFNQKEIQTPILSAKTETIISENVLDTNLSEDYTELITKNIKSDLTELENDSVVNDNVCTDGKAELNVLVNGQEVTTSITEIFQNKEQCLNESVEGPVIQEKQAQGNFTTYENNNVNMHRSKGVNYILTGDNFIDGSKQSAKSKFYCKDSSSSDDITDTEEITDVKHGRSMAGNVYLSHSGQIVHENSHIKNVAMHSKDIGKITEDIILSHKENENMSSHHNHQRDISLQDEATSDFKLTYDLDNEYYCDTSSETIEKNGVGHKYITIMPVELECLEMQNNVCEVDQSKLCNISKIEKSENNCKDIVDVAKSKNTKNHSSSQENGLKDAEFLKYLEQKQDIIMDENPDLTYQEVSAYLLKTWHYEQSLKSDKKVSNVYEITTTDEDNHQSLHSKTKSKTNENPNKYLQTSIGVKMLENNVKDVCIQSKPKRNAKGSDLPYKLAEVNNVKKSDNRKTSKVIASLRCSKKNIRDLLPLDKCEIGINENLEMRTVSQQICNNKNAIKNSNVPEQEAINENDTENSYFDISKSLDESIEINESVKTLSDIDISSNEKKVPKLIITHLKKITKKNMDPKNHVTNSEITILSNDTKPTLSSEEKNIDSSDKSENTENKVEFKNMTAANVNIHNSITNNDTKTISIKSDNNYIAPSEVISKEQKNEAPKHRPSLRLKRPVVTSDTNSTTAKCPTLGDMNLNEILINNEKDTKKNLEETSMTTLDNVLELTNSVEISLCKENQKARPSTSPPSDGISRKKQSKIDDFLKRTKNLNSSFNTGTDKDCKANQMTILQNSCNSNDSVNTNLVDTDQILSKQQVRKETLPTKSMDLENPEFIEYLELRQDQLIDEHPELTLEQITTYLYNTWFFEGSIKSENKKTDDFEQRSLVKGLNQSPIDAKRIRKKNYVGTEKDISSKNEIPLKEKSKRRAERQFYREDFSDFEDDLDIYQMYKPTTGQTKDEQGTSKNNTNTCQELLPRDLETYVADDNVVEDEIAENVDQVEEYFRLLTEPKPNLFKGLAREKVCQVCEKAGDLVKCKGCHSFFHDNCSRKGVEIKESPNPVRGRKKKRKNRGRKPKNLDDSYEGHSDKSQEHDLSFEHETESHTITNAEEFEEKLSVKLKEIIDDPNLKYDTNSSEEELDWSDVEIGACKIVEIIPKKKKQELVDFKCADCEENSVPICFVCKRTISRKKQIAHRQKCQVAHCYKYYHIECLEHWPQTQYTTAEKKGIEYVESLQCPRHVCHTCVCDDPRGCKTRFSGDKLARCLRCPATYHTFTKCLPAGTQIISGSHIICPRHYEHRPGKVPCHVNTGWCFICALGGTLICCEYCPTSFHAECLNIEPPEGGYMCEDCETGCLPLYGEMVWVKLGHYRWWPGLILHPSEIPENILAVKHAQGEFVVRFFGQYDHYWVNRGRVFPFQEGDTGRVSSRNSKIDAAFAMAVEHAHRAYDILKNKSSSNEGDEDIALSLLPPHFVKLKVNKPCGSLINKKIDIEESSLTQCECNPNVEDPCGLYSHCLNRMLLTECGPICKAGERCCNRAFEKRQYPRMEPYRTPARGWGLHTLDDIRAGQFVIEYVGELIDEVEFQRRMKWKHQVRDENYYFLTLDKERMIDAGPKGNLARFMNHSCDPNCETQKWTVLGDVRVGLFALYDIPAKSELTFNYNLECAGIEKKRCMCGTARCSGFMGAKPKQEEPKKNKVKRTYKKRKRIELSPTNEQPKPKRRQPKNRELTEIEKDLLIIKNATNGISSDSESSRRNSTDSVKRKNNSPSTKKVKIDKKKIDQPECDRTVVNHKTYDVD